MTVHTSIRSHVLAVLTVLALSLGSAGAARAATVAGAGSLLGERVQVSAHSQAGVAQGTVSFSDPNATLTGDLLANVFGLYVAGNGGIVAAVITQSTFDYDLGYYLYLFVVDAGPNVEYVEWVISLYPVPVPELLDQPARAPSSSPTLTQGHIVVTP
jgi:hypothetical protein